MTELSYEIFDDAGAGASVRRRTGLVICAGICVGLLAAASVTFRASHADVSAAISLDASPMPSWFLMKLGLSLAIGGGLGLSLGCNVGQAGPGLGLGLSLGLAFALGFAVLARAVLTSAFILDGLRMGWEFRESASRLKEAGSPAPEVMLVIHATFLVVSSLIVASGSTRGSIGCAVLIAYLVLATFGNVQSYRRAAFAETRREERYLILRSVSIAGAMLCTISYNLLVHQMHELEFGTPPDSQEVYSNRGLMLFGRVLFVIVFLSSVLECAMEFAQVTDMLGRKGIPVPKFFAGVALVLSASGVVLLVAHDALNIVQGSREVGGISPVSWAWIGSLLLILALVPASVVLHIVQEKEKQGRKSLGPITFTDQKKIRLTSTKLEEDRSNWSGGVKSLSIVGALLFFLTMEP